MRTEDIQQQRKKKENIDFGGGLLMVMRPDSVGEGDEDERLSLYCVAI